MNTFAFRTVAFVIWIGLAGCGRADMPWVPSKHGLFEVQIIKKAASLNAEFAKGGIALTVNIKNKTAQEQTLDGFELYAPDSEPAHHIAITRKFPDNSTISPTDLIRFKIPANSEVQIELESFIGLPSGGSVQDALREFKIDGGPILFATKLVESKDQLEIKLPPAATWK